MNFAEGLTAVLPTIGRKTTGFAVPTAAHRAASTAHEADRLVWQALSASPASDRAGWNFRVHHRF